VPVTDGIYSFFQNTMRITEIQIASERLFYIVLSIFRPISFYVLLLDFIAYRCLSFLQVRGLHLYVLTAGICAVLQIGRSLVRSQLVSFEIFIDIKSLRSHYGPGVDSAFNRNEYQERFLGVKAAGA